jgi:predicted aspartyl protease
MLSLKRSASVSAILLIAFSVPACPQGPANTVHAQTIHMDVVHGKPYVMVMVNGKGPFRFVVDTGTGGEALITPALADQLQLPVLGQARLVDPSGQGGRHSQILSIQSLNLGTVEFTDVKAIRHSLAGEDETCMGLLGFTLFRDYLLTLDFPNHSLTLAQGALSSDGNQSVLSFRMPDGVPLVPLRIGNEQVEAQLDSGGLGLTLPEHLASQLKFASTPVVYANGESLATRFQLKEAKLGTDIHIGRYTFAQPLVEIHPAFPLVNLGACPMQHFAITFDQKNLLVRFDSDHEILHLDSTPTTMRMQSTPAPKPPDLALVPVG